MCVSRGINFYFLLITSAILTVIVYILEWKCSRTSHGALPSHPPDFLLLLKMGTMVSLRHARYVQMPAVQMIVTLVWYFKDGTNEMRIGTLSLMYWGATLMWLVDAVVEYIELKAAYFSPEPVDMLNDFSWGYP